jgi:hypothetical protein
MVSRSSIEKEYKSIEYASSQVMWVQSILKELCISGHQNARLCCDNIGATYLLANPVFHAQIKCIEIYYLARKLLEIRFVSSKYQLAYGFTKPLSVRQLEHFRRILKLEKG